MARQHRAPLTAAQAAAFLASYRRDLADQTPHQLPDILYAHGVPLMAKALGDILTYGEVLPF